MCYQRAQRLLMAVMLGLMMYLYISGFMLIANIINVLMIVMLLLWAFADFCPASAILSKFLPSCDNNKYKE